MALCARYLFNGNVTNTGSVSTNDTWTTSAVYEKGNLYATSLADGAMTWDADTTSQILTNTAFTWMGWIYVNAETGSTKKRSTIFGNTSIAKKNNKKYTIAQSPSCNDLNLSWMNDQSGVTFVKATITGALPSYAWTHVAVTYNGSNINIYINGTLKSTILGCTSTSSTFAYETKVIHTNSYRRFQDIRIYNECVSASEIARVSKGMCVHYKLNEKPSNNTVSDSSGLDCKGTTTDITDLSLSSDTPRYGHSLLLGKNNTNKFLTSSIPHLWTSNFTCSFWISPNSIKDMTLIDNGYLDATYNTVSVYMTADDKTYDTPEDYIYLTSTTSASKTNYKSSTYINSVADTSTDTLYKSLKRGFRLGIVDKSINVICEDLSLTASSVQLSNDWYHVVVTSDENRKVTIYINGEVTANGTFEDYSDLLNDSSSGIVIYHSGQYMSDFRWFGRALTEDEVIDLYGISSDFYYS